MEKQTQISKRGMVSQLTVVAFGIIGLVILVGIGITVLSKLGATVAVCSADKTFNATAELCQNATATATATGTAYTSIAYGVTQIGSTGLLSWLPAVIALLIGVFFLAYFAGKKQGKSY